MAIMMIPWVRAPSCVMVIKLGVVTDYAISGGKDLFRDQEFELNRVKSALILTVAAGLREIVNELM
jgi:hypothetical protein